MCQKELDLNKVKIEASTHIKIENSERQQELIKAKLELKAQETTKESAKIQAKKDIYMGKLCLHHEYQLAELQMRGLPQYNNSKLSCSLLKFIIAERPIRC
jgi:UDP-galactopyranose mutase